jgi:hypothetical protein
MGKRNDNDTIYLGSGDLMIKEYTGNAMPKYSEFDPETDLLGYISGGATLEYKPTFYEAKDDLGKVSKVIITDEEAILKSGILTWNGKTLKQLCSTARVTESAGIRTVKIGGVGNNDGKSYAICFHHTDPVDGDVWILIRGVNQSGFSLAFVKDKETVIDAEIKCLPMDKEGTLIEYTEEIGTTS